ncbi:LacI family DNA-binding transcriptional regulator [Subtercola frigoramans]|uniref:DNA-binding LacI/PurR family transcriptional regulator n=1 Tax=Subtercola frigoramans TaxID=120298 RepID=A0ABS2L9F2_9MICO|nr:LacI family DNA-binding transcriptional regulator [Subtercola frigoramans]MBM7473733.1 DNA-binding LacI/PurR family transcriptional regulator [Subtercola frigoramans]
MSANNQPHPGATPRPTLADVAKRAGVSGSTASIAFSGDGSISAKTRDRVLAAAEELNYAGPDPRARSLRQGRSGIVGVILEDRVLHSFRDPMMIAALDGISQQLGDSGGMLLLTSNGEGESTIQTAVFDAAIFMGCSPHLARSIEIMRQRNVPMVAIEGQAFAGVLSVALDNREASVTLAQVVHDLGHRRVATITLPLDSLRERRPLTDELVRSATTATTLDRLEGAREVYPALTGVVAANSSTDEGMAAALVLLDAAPELRPTAIIAQSDLLAVGAIRAAESLGLRVPGDLTVVGFDGARIEGMNDYDLTTMVQPAMEKGRAAGFAVTELLAGRSVGDVSLTSVLHIGNTSGPVAQ